MPPAHSHRRSAAASLYALAIVLTLPSCFLFSDEPLLSPEFTDPCSVVHETYPNVGEDSCAWVLTMMRLYPPPEFLPAATDTGGPLLAARVLTDTGGFLFVAGPTPEGFLRPSCGWWKPGWIDELSLFLIQGTYCQRPPADRIEKSLAFFFTDSMRISQGPDGVRVDFQYGDPRQSIKQFELLQDESFKMIDAVHDPGRRIAYGRFEAVLHNRRDPTDSIRLVDGRFDMRY